MGKPLIDLDPAWVGAGGEGISDQAGNPVPARHGVGLACECPCGCGSRLYVGFENPLDGGPPHVPEHPLWKRTGETFETLTLIPSIQRHKIGEDGCTWHGFITNGEAVNC